MKKNKKSNIKKHISKNGKVTYSIAFMYKGFRYKKTLSSKKECERYRSDVMRYVDQNERPYIECTKTLEQVLDEYMESKKGVYRITTERTYSIMIDKIKSDKSKIAKRKIKSITYTEMQKLFDNLSIVNGKETVNLIKVVLNLAYKYALRCSYIENNIMPLIEIKAKEQKKQNQKTTVSLNELEMICNEIVKDGQFFKHSIAIALFICYYTGSRISECLALNKDDFNFINHTVTFNKQLFSKCSKKEFRLVPMKTDASYATIPIPSTLEDILKQWFKINPYEIVVCDDKGNYLGHNKLTYIIRKANKALGIEFHPHLLRHTYGSELVMSGVNIKSVQSLMRHQNINTTMNTYVSSNFNKELEEISRVFGQNDSEITPKLPLRN